MIVQQGQLSPTDTTKNMESYYSDAVVTSVSDVDRSIHNGTQFVRLVLRRPQAIDAHSASSALPDTLTSAAHYINGVYTANPTSGVNIVRVGFASGQLVATTKITIYTVQPIDTTPGNWEVATSLDGTDAQFNLTNFKATGLSVVETAVTLDAVPQFKYEISFTAPGIGGLRYWRVKHVTEGKFNDVTEVEVVEPLTPTISYFDTDGSFASSFPFTNSNILDAVYDNINNVFYSIRFNDEDAGTSTVTLSDDFGGDDAGTASGTNNFNPGRWDESSSNSAFLRTSDTLSYNTSAGKGQLDTTYTLGDFTATIDINPQVLATDNMWFVLRAIDSTNKVVVQEGVSRDISPATTGVIFAHSVENFVDATANSELQELRPIWHNTSAGTESFEVTFSGSAWLVSGTVAGALSDATTGVLYDEAVDASTPMEFLISSTATPSTGEKFTFDIITDNIDRVATATGVLSISRTGSDLTTASVFGAPKTITSVPLTIELFGSTVGAINISADNYNVVGSGTFSDVSVFTVERRDSEGKLVSGNPVVIEALDIIGNPSLGYNDYLDGRVQIAATSSGGGGGFVYLKIDDTMYKYSNSVSILGLETGSGAILSTTGQIAKEGTHSLAWTHESGLPAGLPFLTYIEYDAGLDIIHLRTLDKDTLTDSTDTKEILLDITGYSSAQEFTLFYDQNDFDTLYYVDASTDLQAFNIDDRISAFMAVNAEDVTLPAGTEQQTPVNADVINAWGEVLSGKVVTFSVTVGDGAITPATDTTDGSGRATSQFIVGSTVGVSTVTATVTEA